MSVIRALLEAWTAEIRNGLRSRSHKGTVITQWIGFSIFSFMLYTIAGSVHKYAISKLDPSLILQLEITFINLFMAIGLIMLLKSLIDGTLRQGYDAPELPILIKAPIRPHILFAYKMVRVICASLPESIFWLFPPWLAMARVFRANIGFFLSLPFVLFLLLLITEASVALMTLLFVYLFYSRRTIRLVGKIALLLFTVAVSFLMVSYTIMDPTDREKVFEWMSRYAGPLVSRRWYPHVWASNLLMYMLGLEVKGNPWRWSVYLVSAAISLIGLVVGISEKLYYLGWEKSKTLAVSSGKRVSNLKLDLQLFFKGSVRAIVFKDLVQVVHDPRYWSMLIILFLVPPFILITIARKDIALMSKLTILCAQQLIYGVMLSLSLNWASFKSENEAWWILRSSPLTAKELFIAKLLMASVIAMIYVELFVVIGIMMIGAPLRWWPVVILSVGLATVTFASLNAMISSLPSVALTKEKRFSPALTMTMFLNIGMTVGSVTAITVVQESHRPALPWVSIGLLILFIVILFTALRIGWRNAERLIEPQS